MISWFIIQDEMQKRNYELTLACKYSRAKGLEAAFHSESTQPFPTPAASSLQKQKRYPAEANIDKLPPFQFLIGRFAFEQFKSVIGEEFRNFPSIRFITR